jgi:hypothetical protein
MKHLTHILFGSLLLALATPAYSERRGDPGDRPNPQAEQKAEEQRRQAEEKRIRAAQTLEAAKQEALKIIADGSKIRQEMQELQRGKADLADRLATFNRTDALMKTGIFGVVATGIIGILAIVINYRGGRARRRLDEFEAIEKQHELKAKGVIK